MAFLDYLLGGAVGGFEGYERKKERERLAQKEEEDRQIRQLALLNQLGFRSTGLVRQTPDVAAQDIVGDIAQAVPAKSFDTTVGEAFKAAGERGMGVKPQAPQSFTESQNKAFQAARGRGFGVTAGAPMGGALGTPVAEALQRGMTTDRTMAAPSAAERKPLLDSSRLDQLERGAAMQAASPETQMDIKGIGRLGFEAPESDAEKQRKEEARFEQNIAGFSEEEKRIARLARVLPANVLQAITQPKEPRQSRLQLNEKTGQLINIDTKEVFNIPGYKIPPKEPRAQSQVQLPEGTRKRLEGYESGISMVRDAVEMLKQTPQAIGPIKGRIFQSVLDAYDKAGVGVRAYLENLSGEIRNQRFGGALTASEAAFAERQLPSEKDLAENAITKLNNLEKYLETKRKAAYRINKMEYTPMFPPEAEQTQEPTMSAVDALRKRNAGGSK